MDSHDIIILSLNDAMRFQCVTSVAQFYYTERRMTMKKYMPLMLALLMCACLCSCGNKESASAENGSKQTEQDNTLNIQQSTVVVESTEPTEDAMLSVEDFELIKIENNEIWFKVKIRNISDTDLEQIVFDYQVLDKNGDILCDQTCGATNVASGQAIWAGQYRTHDLSNAEEATAICFVSSPSWMQTKSPLTEKVVFQFKDFM